MSKIQFIKSPFPDNHNGFDYAPASFMDVQREMDSELQEIKNSVQSKKLLSIFASIFK